MVFWRKRLLNHIIDFHSKALSCFEASLQKQADAFRGRGRASSFASKTYAPAVTRLKDTGSLPASFRWGLDCLTFPAGKNRVKCDLALFFVTSNRRSSCFPPSSTIPVLLKVSSNPILWQDSMCFACPTISQNSILEKNLFISFVIFVNWFVVQRFTLTIRGFSYNNVVVWVE